MQLNLSPRELRDLMEIVSVATTVAGTEASETDERYSAWVSLQNRIFELAEQDPKLDKIIESDDRGDYSLTESYIEKSYLTQKIDDFSEHVFWSGLVLRLADKSLEDHLGEKEFNQLSEEERRALTSSLEESFWRECSTYGIDRLGFIVPPSDA